MAANVQPVFAIKPETVRAVITSATSDRSGSTPANLVELFTATTDGTKCTKIKFKHVSTSTAGWYLIFTTDTDGNNLRLFAELQILAASPSTTISTNENTYFDKDFQLKAGQKVLVGATSAASNIHVHGSIGHFS